jgi:hypothetical protein
MNEELNLDTFKEGIKASPLEQIRESLKTKSIVQGQKYQIDLGCILNIEQTLWLLLD